VAAWSDHALVRLQLKDTEGYRQACARLVKAWKSGADRNAAALAAWTCSIAPDSKVDLDKIVEALEKVKPTASTPSAYLALRARGAAHYRYGDFEAAVKHLTEAAELRKQPSPSTWYFLAMAHHRLNNKERAKEWLEKANRWLEQSHNKPAANAQGRLSWDDLPWNERATLELLGREVRGLLRSNK
jgi:tetratricopeptide (TPR) repeat protein